MVRTKVSRRIVERARDGIAGLREGVRRETSVRTHLALSTAAILGLVAAGPDLPWVLTLFVLIVLGLAIELMNGALEAALDRLHPDHDPLVGTAKDMGSAAALVINVAAALVFLTAVLL